MEDIEAFLRTPKDWDELNNESRATTLVLSFIGYVARPKNIPEALLEKCVEAFNANRGKVQWEEKAVLEAIEEYYSSNQSALGD